MNNKRSLGCVLTGALIILVICGAIAGFATWRLNTRGPEILVEIKRPQTTMLANVNEALPLIVSAEASDIITRLEVYADGALIAAANGEGQNAAMLAQTWTPSTVGRHVLVARAFLDAEHFSDSEVVFVDALDLSALPLQVNVDDLPRGEGVTEISVGDLATASGTTLEEIVRLNPSLSSTGSIPSGTLVSIPRLAPEPGIGSPVPPPAPGAPGSPAPSTSDPHFEGETHSCNQIAMRWTGSDFETGYTLYRLAPGDSSMTLVATLPVTTISYADNSISRAGTYRYFLSPIWRGGGSGITSMLAVEIPADCAPVSSTSANLRLSLMSLTAQESFTGVYCYVSVNGSRYERLPAGDGLLRPTSGNLYYDLPLQLPNRGQYTLGPTADGLVRLEGECWGRRGVESVRIGRFAGNHASSEWDGRDLTSDVAFEPIEVASLDTIPLMTGGSNFIRYRIQSAASHFDLTGLYNGTIQVPLAITDPFRIENPTVPPPTNVRLVNRASGICEDLPMDDPNLGTILCQEQIVRHIAWDWSASEQVPQSAVTGFMLITSIEDAISTTPAGEGYTHNVNSGTARSAPVPNYSQRWRCGATVRFTVRAVTNFGMSEPSEAFEVRLPACPSARNLLIRIESLTISPSSATGQVLDRGDICILCDDRRLELNGMISLADDNNSIGDTNPPSHGAGHVLFGLCPTYTKCRNEGTYTTNSGWWMEMDYPVTNRPLAFTTSIIDYDTENSEDLFCVALAVLPARSAQEWSRANETVVLQSDFGEATCRFQITVTGQTGN